MPQNSLQVSSASWALGAVMVLVDLGMIWEFPKIREYLFGGPHNKDYSILGSTLGSPHFEQLPYGTLRQDAKLKVPVMTTIGTQSPMSANLQNGISGGPTDHDEDDSCCRNYCSCPCTRSCACGTELSRTGSNPLNRGVLGGVLCLQCLQVVPRLTQ